MRRKFLPNKVLPNMPDNQMSRHVLIEYRESTNS